VATVLRYPHALGREAPVPRDHRSLWGDALHRFLRNRVAVLGLAVLLVLVAVALAAPLIENHDPNYQYYDHLRESPSGQFWLGNDLLGRDQWSRIVHGARISLSIGILTQVIALAIGLSIGLAAGLGGRGVDNLVMRATDIAYAFPDLLLIILLLSVFGPSFIMIFIAIGLVSWPTLARLVRAQVLSLQERDFILAARALGATRVRILVAHIMPNSLGPVIVAAVFGIPFAIFAEAALSFIGLGLPPPPPPQGPPGPPPQSARRPPPPPPQK
jgi:oligopeptide transport system permease protein